MGIGIGIDIGIGDIDTCEENAVDGAGMVGAVTICA
jgi:hypothetical protein